MTSSKCRFCDESAPLSRSHIIPEFMYKPTYDATGTYTSVTSHPRHPVRPMQVGARERLLCHRCEQRFGRYETASAPVLKAVYENPARRDYIRVTGCDQHALKMMALAILWRAHVSSLHEFAQVKLGPYAARIHALLDADDPGDPYEVAVLVVRLRGGGLTDRVVLPPTRKRFAGLNAYNMLTLGMHWVFAPSKGAATALAGWPLVGTRPDLCVPVLDVDDREASRHLHRLAAKWKKL